MNSYLFLTIIGMAVVLASAIFWGFWLLKEIRKLEDSIRNFHSSLYALEMRTKNLIFEIYNYLGVYREEIRAEIKLIKKPNISAGGHD